MTPIPEDIKSKIGTAHDRNVFKGNLIQAAEYGYSLAQEEIERLKALIEKAHTTGWLDFPEDDFHAQHISIESSWQQFKKENNL